jgi:hypothetical protein
MVAEMFATDYKFTCLYFELGFSDLADIHSSYYIAASCRTSLIIQVTDSTVLRARYFYKTYLKVSLYRTTFWPALVIIRCVKLLMDAAVPPFCIFNT